MPRYIMLPVMNNFAIFLSLTILLAISVSSCESEISSTSKRDLENTDSDKNKLENLESEKARSSNCIDPDLKKLSSDQEITLCNGNKAKGELEINDEDIVKSKTAAGSNGAEGDSNDPLLGLGDISIIKGPDFNESIDRGTWYFYADNASSYRYEIRHSNGIFKKGDLNIGLLSIENLPSEEYTLTLSADSKKQSTSKNFEFSIDTKNIWVMRPLPEEEKSYAVSTKDNYACFYMAEYVYNYDYLKNSVEKISYTNSWINSHSNRWQLMNDGNLFVAGGKNSDGNFIRTAQILNTSTLTWSEVSPAPNDRALAAVAVLLDGRIMNIAGYDGSNSYLANADIYDPSDDTWETIAIPTSVARQSATATRLNDGRVILTSGWRFSSLSTTYIYDPGDDSWTEVANSWPRKHYSGDAIALDNDNILFVGGYDSSTWLPTTIATLYNPADDTWEPVSNTNMRRSGGGIALFMGNSALIGSTPAVDVGDPIGFEVFKYK